MGTNRAEDILDIHQLKSRYFRFMDTKDWARWRELFTDDLVFYIEDSVFPETTEPTTVGGDAFVEYVSQVLLTAVTVHQGHMPDIEFTEDGEARGIWAMFDWGRRCRERPRHARLRSLP
jgi:ketosteroid isomerase-like protein